MSALEERLKVFDKLAKESGRECPGCSSYSCREKGVRFMGLFEPVVDQLLATLRKAMEQRNEYIGYLPNWHTRKYGNSITADDAELLSILNGEPSENGGGE